MTLINHLKAITKHGEQLLVIFRGLRHHFSDEYRANERFPVSGGAMADHIGTKTCGS